MLINIIADIENKHGLEQDYRLLKDLFESLGHTVNGIHYRKCNPAATPYAAVTIFLEVPIAGMFHSARQTWIIPNPEWWDFSWNSWLPHANKILCKTLHAVDIFKKLEIIVPLRPSIDYVGFESQDLYDSKVERKPAFLHLAGKSPVKNTQAVLHAWKNLQYPLTIVSTNPDDGIRAQLYNPKYITYRSRIKDDDEFVQIMNSHQFHIMPSEMEGWGHAIHEALGVGAVVLTTDGVPMNESSGINRALLIPPDRVGQNGPAPRYHVSPKAVEIAVKKALAMLPEQIADISKNARESFLKDRAAFRARFAKLLKTSNQ